MSEIDWESILERIKDTALGQLARPVWLAELAVKGDKAFASKIGGTPLLAGDEDWPACQNCGKPMALLVELNLNGLPTPIGTRFGGGLLQAFYCWSTRPSCDVDCEAWAPESTRTKQIRMVQPTPEWRRPTTKLTSEGRRIAPRASSADDLSVLVEDPITPTCITGWVEDVDYPTAEDAGALGLGEYAAYLREVGVEEAWGYNFPNNGTKLGGWPYWLQYRNWGRCPICHMPMERLVIQLSPEGFPSDRKFGDGGIAYLLQCMMHPDQLALGWQC